MQYFCYSIEVAGEVSLGPLRHSFSTPSNEHALGESSVWVLDLDERKLDAPIRELFNQVRQLPLACCLYIENTLFPGVCLEGIGEGRFDGEDSPDAVGWRGRSWTGRRGSDDLLVAGGDGRSVLGQV